MSEDTPGITVVSPISVMPAAGVIEDGVPEALLAEMLARIRQLSTVVVSAAIVAPVPPPVAVVCTVDTAFSNDVGRAPVTLNMMPRQRLEPLGVVNVYVAASPEAE